jgi:hypothetical protein
MNRFHFTFLLLSVGSIVFISNSLDGIAVWGFLLFSHHLLSHSARRVLFHGQQNGIHFFQQFIHIERLIEHGRGAVLCGLGMGLVVAESGDQYHRGKIRSFGFALKDLHAGDSRASGCRK